MITKIFFTRKSVHINLIKEVEIMSKIRSKKSMIPYLFIMPWIIGFLVFTIGPLLFSLVISFFDFPLIGDAKFIGFNNYIQMFTQDKLFYHSLGVTFKFAVIFVPLYIIIALSLALLLNQDVKGQSFFLKRCFIYLPLFLGWLFL